MDYQGFQRLEFERRGRILEVRLAQPERLNAVDGLMHTELARLFPLIAEDDACDVVILTGLGRAFSAGGDLHWMQEMIDDPLMFDQSGREAKQIVYGLIDCEKPVLAKLNGHAVGLGATIALFCDMIFAAEHAKIGDPHIRVGFTAGDGGAVIWPQLIGYPRAKEYLLTGDTVSADEAARMGLINRAVPADQLDQVVEEMALRLINGPTRAIRWTKMTVNMGLRDLATKIMDASLAYEMLSNMTGDHRNAVKALLNKQPVEFQDGKATQ